jgi:23S rRNA (uracil1939-C5)-methyltransferase
MLSEGQQVELTIEKPASGGWMIARHLGQVVLVRGAIPGERVAAWIERVEPRLAYAATRDVIERSPDRRDPHTDPLCGGLLYSHIGYQRQLTIKADVIRDAFARLGRHPIELPLEVMGSPEEGYRMRARFHVVGDRAGFYREGTHQLCDAEATGQLSQGIAVAAQIAARELNREASGATGFIAIAENIVGDQRAVYVELKSDTRLTQAFLDGLVTKAGVTGISARGIGQTSPHAIAGTATISDSLEAVTGGRIAEGLLLRQAESFFQGNRFLLPTLVTAVLNAVSNDGDVLDLYAGVGLFAVTLAAVGHSEITAVEGDRSSGADLRRNARPYSPKLEAVVTNVETYLSHRRGRPAATIVVDPPRIGLSKEAITGIIRHGSPRIVYVSCDPPTLARDARRLLDAGYRLDAIQAFDLFPNTPHVEVLSVFLRR